MYAGVTTEGILEKERKGVSSSADAHDLNVSCSISVL
jgi:hypothetical protein